MLECGIPLILKDDGPNMVIRKVEKDKTANAETQDDTRDDNDNNEEEQL